MANLTCNYCKKRFKDLVLPFNIPVIYICAKCSQPKKQTNTKKLRLAYNSYLAEKKRLPKNNVRLIWNNLKNDYDISIFFSDNSLINNFKSTIYL